MSRLSRFSVSVIVGLGMILAGVPALACAEAVASGPTQPGTVISQDEGSELEGAADVDVKPAPKKARVYTMNGDTKKGSWKYKTVKRSGKKIKLRVSYRFKDGTYPAPITKIDSKLYYFKNSKGVLGTSSKAIRIVKINKKRYCVGPHARVLKEWRTKGGKLYYFGGPYRCAKCSCTKDGIKLTKTGAAKSNLDSELKIKCIKFLDKCCDRNDKKSVKLRKAWNSLTDESRWHYTIYKVVLSDKTWAKRYAYTQLTNHHGDCYGFAATFCALAQEIGYEPRLVMCRVPGSRDHAPDGYTHHGLLLINGRYFDPEAEFAGWCHGIYNLKSYPMGIKAMHTKKFSSYDGSVPARHIYQKKPVKTKYLAVKKGSYYYGYKNSTSGSKLTGLWCIKDKLYVFSSKGRMTVAAYKRLKKASARMKPWVALRAILGKPSSKSVSDSCYDSGKDVIYKYARVTVSTFAPSNGSKEIVMSYGSR